jgi:peptidoglycan/xylan/chitin deacetylase (PgdA/CDA1 family)
VYERILTFIAACFYYSGLVKLACWWRQQRGPALVILNYHRAAGGDLRRHLLYFHRHYRVLHLEAALEELYAPNKSRQRNNDQRTPLVMTFDDGYHDNYTHGFKLASELRVPITIFLIPGYIESGSRFWWLEGDHLVTHAQAIEATIEGHTYHLDTLEELKALAQEIDTRARYATSVAERESFLDSVHKKLAESSAVTDEERAALPVIWEEVRAMEGSGWVSFGAHTMHHPLLAYLTDPAEVQFEVSECRAVLERQLGHPMHAFAYPVGGPEHIGVHGVCAVREAGYKWAVTTIYGFNTPQTDPYLLRRIEVDVDQHWLLLAAKASGVWGFFSGLYRALITRIRKLVNLSETVTDI